MARSTSISRRGLRSSTFIDVSERGGRPGARPRVGAAIGLEAQRLTGFEHFAWRRTSRSARDVFFTSRGTHSDQRRRPSSRGCRRAGPCSSALRRSVAIGVGQCGSAWPWVRSGGSRRGWSSSCRARLPSRKNDQEQHDAGDDAGVTSSLCFLSSTLALDVVLELTKLALEVVAGDALLRHHRRLFLQGLLLRMRQAATPITAKLQTSAIRYGSSDIHVAAEGVAELVLDHAQHTEHQEHAASADQHRPGSTRRRASCRHP